ncbi:PREDICTED: glutathione S-transferase T3-like [Brassica oleracea var. oleracea]|uniref:Myb-like domain-containing protein n=1 Tax=Brassica oleracea var. oleracea TaxID=109376 RepID=A0A0D3DEH6_BRAOL|nr:PREDICTED: glutathione S-transferase T3-like [Brassica oleracea var. oleracea]
MASYSPGFVSLLTSQTGEFSTPGFVNLSGSESIDLESPDLPAFSSQSSEASTVKERKKWSPKENVILISAWLNTNKDPIVGNEQKLGTFWSRIQNYYNSSVQHVGLDTRELGQCKQRWGRLNNLVCKFCGCYDAALRDQSSGENDNDVMKKALDMFFNDHGCKFTLEHAWRELRHDKKWASA